LLKESRLEEAKLLGYRTAGDLLGESSLTGEEARSEWALVVDPVEVAALPCEKFWEMLNRDPGFRQQMVVSLVDHLVTTDESHLRAAAHERDLFERLSSLSDEHERMAQLTQLRADTMHFIIHDLRAPLNMINSAVDMLESQGRVDGEEDTHTLVLAAKRGVQRMLSLVETLLDVDRLDEGNASLNLELIDLSKIAEDVFQRIQPLAAVSDIAMHFDKPDHPLPTVMADRLRIDRVITNLVDNALKFTLPDTHVNLSVWQDGDLVCVAVDDEGVGIPSDQRGRIFERFAQVEGGPQGRRGFGLGLAYCRSAITAHGGRIWVEDAAGKNGMRFAFALPIIAHS
jgi:signal transduction histidine kinase